MVIITILQPIFVPVTVVFEARVAFVFPSIAAFAAEVFVAELFVVIVVVAGKLFEG